MTTSEITLHIISILIVMAGGILSLGDKWFPMDAVPAWLTHSWQLVLVGATLVDRIGKLILNYIQTNLTPLQRSAAILEVTKLIVLVSLTFFFCSCTTTTTKNADGSSMTVTRQDPKVIQSLEPLIQIGVQAGVDAALHELQKEQ